MAKGAQIKPQRACEGSIFRIAGGQKNINFCRGGGVFFKDRDPLVQTAMQKYDYSLHETMFNVNKRPIYKQEIPGNTVTPLVAISAL
jgi:hypothetical protein